MASRIKIIITPISMADNPAQSAGGVVESLLSAPIRRTAEDQWRERQRRGDPVVVAGTAAGAGKHAIAGGAFACMPTPCGARPPATSAGPYWCVVLLISRIRRRIGYSKKTVHVLYNYHGTAPVRPYRHGTRREQGTGVHRIIAKFRLKFKFVL